MSAVHDEVLAAVGRLADAFGRHDTAACFAAFRPDATFALRTHPEPLQSRAACAELWASWERETIVFAPTADGWLAVHEHLSPVARTEETR